VKFKLFILLILFLLIISNRFVQAYECVQGEVLVKMASTILVREGSEWLNVQRELGVTSWKLIYPVSKSLRTQAAGGTWFKMSFSSSYYSPEEAVNLISGLPGVLIAQPNYIYHTLEAVTPNDFQPQQITAGLRKIQIEEAWGVTEGSPDIVIAIIDTGVDWNHPDLIENMWTNPADPWDDPRDPNSGDGEDNDENGFVDDYRGWDFVTAHSVPSGEDGYPPDNNPDDYFGHGTFCSSIASAVTDNAQYVAGAGWRCKIMPVRAGYYDGRWGSFDSSDVAAAIQYAADNGADIINMSFGGGSSDQNIADAVDYAYDKGVILVAAAGNDSTTAPSFPASLPEVISVGASKANDKRASYSNYGTYVDLFAPGGDSGCQMYGFYPDGAHSQTGATPLRHDIGYGSGTSFSSPLVAGCVGLLLTLYPELTPRQVLEHLKGTADVIPVLNPIYRLNAYRLLTEPVGGPYQEETTITIYLKRGWNLISFPLQEVSSFSPSPSDLEVYYYSEEGFQKLTSPIQILPGVAMWANLTGQDSGSLVAKGKLVTSADFTVTLTPGWNAIANPFYSDIFWGGSGDSYVLFNNSPLTSNPNVISTTIYGFNTDTESFSPYAYNNATLSSTRAYLIFSKEGGELKYHQKVK